jgi:sugar phosphate permease
LLFGPDSLLSGTMSQDLGGRAATGRVAGIINGMGSVGAIFSPLIVAKVSERFGWSTLFFGFCAVTVVAAALLFLSAILVERHRSA